MFCLQRLQKSFDDGTERLGQGAGGGGHPQEDTQVYLKGLSHEMITGKFYSITWLKMYNRFANWMVDVIFVLFSVFMSNLLWKLFLK